MQKHLLLIILFLIFAVATAYNGHLFEEKESPDFEINQVSGFSNQKSAYEFNIVVDSLLQNISVTENITLEGEVPDTIIFDWLPAKIAGNCGAPEGTPSLNQIVKITFAGSEEETFEYFFSNDSTFLFVVPGKKEFSRIKLQYQIFPPILVENFGKASGKNFAFLTDWYATTEHSMNNFSDAKISYPASYLCGSNFEVLNERSDGTMLLNGTVENNFSWFIGESMRSMQTTVPLVSGDVSVEIFTQDEKTNYSERLQRAVSSGLVWLEKNIGTFPFDKINIIDFPRTFQGRNDYAGIITLNSEFISPLESSEPETDLFRGLTRQYFGISSFTNKDECPYVYYSLNDFLAEKIFHTTYGKPVNFYQFAEYYPIRGFLFLSYNQIPILYTLGNYELERGAGYLRSYYADRFLTPVLGPEIDSDNRIFSDSKRSKTVLSFLSIDKSIGDEAHLNVLSEVYSKSDSLGFADAYLGLLETETRENYKSLSGLLTEAFTYNYTVSDLEFLGKNKYSCKVTRTGDGVFPTELAIYTDNDTTIINWDGRERVKYFEFTSENDVVAVEIDPFRKNMLDYNFTDNSFTLEKGYKGAWSVSMRWFFWIQNALMIMGSIG